MLAVGQWEIKLKIRRERWGSVVVCFYSRCGAGTAYQLGVPPPSIRHNEWEIGWDDPLRYPTWAYNYDLVSEAHNDHDTMYYRYMNELDLLTPDQVMLKIIALHYSVVLFLRKSEH